MIFLIFWASFFIFNPLIKISPFVGDNSVVNILIVVVLPAPFVPKSENSSPCLICRFRLSTTILSLNFFVKFVVSIANIICHFLYLKSDL